MKAILKTSLFLAVLLPLTSCSDTKPSATTEPAKTVETVKGEPTQPTEAVSSEPELKPEPEPAPKSEPEKKSEYIPPKPKKFSIYNSDSSKRITVLEHRCEDWSAPNAEEEHYTLITIRDESNKKTRSFKGSLNESLNGVLPGPNKNIVYYLTTGGSGGYCSVREIDLINLTEHEIVEVAHTDTVYRTPKGFKFECSNWLEETKWTEEYDFNGEKLN